MTFELEGHNKDEIYGSDFKVIGCKSPIMWCNSCGSEKCQMRGYAPQIEEIAKKIKELEKFGL